MYRKNTASQKLEVFAWDYSSGAPKTGDAANLTAYVNIDDAGYNALTDTSATEVDSTNKKGWYVFDLSQAETNGNKLSFTAKSSTASVNALPSPRVSFTQPTTGILAPATAGRTLVVDASGLADANAVKVGPSGSGTAQTARDIGASVLLSSGTGTGQLDFTSGVVKANAVQLLGTAWLTPGTAGTPDVNVKLAGGTAWGSGAITAGAIAAAALNGKGDWNVGKTGYSLTQAFPSNFASLGINASGHISRVVLVDTTTANTDMRGTDSAATAVALAALVTTVGVAGAGLTESGGTGDQFSAIPWNAAWDAEVQSECADALGVYDGPTNAEMEARTLLAASYFDPAADTVILTSAYDAAKSAASQASVDTIDGLVDQLIAAVVTASGEPGQGAPPVSTDMRTRIDWLYKFLRNKAIQNNTVQQIYADDGTTVDHKRTVSATDGTLTLGEVVSGP